MGQGNDHRSQQIQIEGVLTFLGAAQYTSMGSAVHLTDTPASGIAAPSNARIALIQAEIQNLRWTGGTTSGLTLSSSVGMLLSTSMDHLVYNAAGATAKTTPVGADLFGLWDSVAVAFKSLSITNLVAFLKTAFTTGVVTPKIYPASDSTTAGGFVMAGYGIIQHIPYLSSLIMRLTSHVMGRKTLSSRKSR